ncbi:probable F-box protein At5g04010, partial [Vigna radiata var. radiata]|uniref:F-box protein n=1 Tax=Vigna radiata var. radiata TaxID=3916 RepID=A0A3Q0F8Y5_VIGRR
QRQASPFTIQSYVALHSHANNYLTPRVSSTTSFSKQFKHDAQKPQNDINNYHLHLTVTPKRTLTETKFCYSTRMSPPPWEALILVATYLDPKTLTIASCVSKSWFSSMSSDHVWKPLLTTQFPSLATLSSAVAYRRLFLMGHAAAARRSQRPPKPSLSLEDLVFAVSVSTRDGVVASGVRAGEKLRMEAAGMFRFGVGCDGGVVLKEGEEEVRVTWNVVLKGWGGVFTAVEREGKVRLVGGGEGWFWEEMPAPGCCSGAVASALVGDLKVGMCEEKDGNGVRVEEVGVGILRVVDWRYVSVEDGLRYFQHFLLTNHVT